MRIAGYHRHDQSRRHRRQAHRLAAGKRLAVLRADRPSPGGRLVAKPVDERRRLLLPAFQELAAVTLDRRAFPLPIRG